jgi:hypothetical protein
MIAFTETLAGESALTRIENRARNYTELRGEIAALVGELNERIDSLTRAKMPLIKKLAARAATEHAELEAAITAAPHLFEKPRTLTFHGVKCGFRKNEGRLEFDDPDRVVQKIYQIFDAPEPFLRIVTQPNKETLATLPGTDLKRLGCRIVDTTDVVVIKPADSDLDKKINALLKDVMLCESQ